MRTRGRNLVLVAAMAVAGTLASGALGPPAGAAGILPPGNPANIAPSSSDYLLAIDAARADEGVGPLTVSPSSLAALSIPEQIFAIINLERVDRGLPAIGFMTAQLDNIAQGGADANTDPGIPSAVSGGSTVAWGGAIWAGGWSSALEADYYWMYDDCNGQSGGCWVHRDIILHEFPSCGGSASVLSMGAAYSTSPYGGGSYSAVITETCAAPTDVTLSWSQVLGMLLTSSPSVIGIAPTPDGQGYWEAEANGTVGAFGDAQNYGSMAGQPLNFPIVGIAATPGGGGYWLVSSDGGIFSFGDAQFYGSTGSLRLNSGIVGIAATPSGGGYWLVAADGGIFSFGNAEYRGSMGGTPLNRPIVGMATDSATGGYWLVASDGGIFSFDAPFYGSTGSLRLDQPIVGMEALGNGRGYRFEASDGGVFCFGQAAFQGSMGGQPLVAPVVGMAADNATNGYWLAAQDGGIFSFGGATYLGRVVSDLY